MPVKIAIGQIQVIPGQRLRNVVKPVDSKSKT
jgi:hypothetical protein